MTLCNTSLAPVQWTCSVHLQQWRLCFGVVPIGKRTLALSPVPASRNPELPAHAFAAQSLRLAGVTG